MEQQKEFVIHNDDSGEISRNQIIINYIRSLDYRIESLERIKTKLRSQLSS